MYNEIEITLDELDAKLAGTAAALLGVCLQAAASRAPEALAAMSNLAECRLTVDVRGRLLNLALTAPARDGSALQLLGLTATRETLCALH